MEQLTSTGWTVHRDHSCCILHKGPYTIYQLVFKRSPRETYHVVGVLGAASAEEAAEIYRDCFKRDPELPMVQKNNNLYGYAQSTVI